VTVMSGPGGQARRERAVGEHVLGCISVRHGESNQGCPKRFTLVSACSLGKVQGDDADPGAGGCRGQVECLHQGAGGGKHRGGLGGNDAAGGASAEDAKEVLDGTLPRFDDLGLLDQLGGMIGSALVERPR
jgi:hypothetical protein